MLSMKSNNRYINIAKKNTSRNFDAKKLDYIQNNSHLVRWIREITIFNANFTTPNNLRVPDLICNGIILEHDTIKAHGELGFENERTLKRNRDYNRANIPFCVINQNLAKLLQIDEAKLSIYLYYHALSQANARKLF